MGRLSIFEAREFVDRYDAPGTLFDLDPPYLGSEDDYGAGVFVRADFNGLRCAWRASPAYSCCR